MNHRWKYVAADGPFGCIGFFTEKPWYDAVKNQWFYADDGDYCPVNMVADALEILYGKRLDDMKRILDTADIKDSLFEVDEDFNLTKVED